MSEFNETNIKDFLRHYGLYNLTSHFTLQGGMDNVNIHVCTPDGDFVIRQYRHTNLQDIHFELETIAFLNEHQFPTPQIYMTLSGEPLVEWQGYPTSLFAFVHGRQLTAMTPQLTRDAGRTLARYHIVHGFSPKHKKARHDFTIFERFAQAPRNDIEIYQSQVKHEDEYVDQCHLCYLVRLALIDRFPQYLAPGQVYGLE